MSERDQLLALDDVALSELCRISFGYGSGPGGQKRNKSSTAVRVELPGTGYFATDCTERSQHRNRANALRKLRLTIALRWRELPARVPEHFPCAPEHHDYPLVLAALFDLLEEHGYDHRAVAAQLGTSPTALVRRIARDPAAWTAFAAERNRRGLPELSAR